MLVLTRKPAERIVIDKSIVIEVLEVHGNRVRIGIEAPQGVTILRQELLAKQGNAGALANPDEVNLANGFSAAEPVQAGEPTSLAAGRLRSDLEVAAAERALGVDFPPSYRSFLRSFEPKRVGDCNFYGIFGHSLLDDIVLVNHLTAPARPSHYVLIGDDDDGRAYFLDTSRRNAAGECPVVVRDPDSAERTAAPSFWEFLHARPRT